MKMTLHRALGELKMLDKRIHSSINDTQYISYHNGYEEPKGYKSATHFNEQARQGYQSITDLIQRRDLIKSKLILANATTEITVADEKMTIAEAIERKTSIQNKVILLNALTRQLAAHTRQIQAENDQMKRRMDERVASDMGSKDRKDHPDEVKRIEDDFIKRNKPSTLDPINLHEEINELSKYIDNFTMEVDAVLSEANALTTIEIEA